MKKIILTGGGTAGHVNPNLALLPQLRRNGYDITYIGGRNGIEKNLVAGYELDYREISAGKLRRYIDMKNITDAFRVVKGFGEAVAVIKSVKPDVVFSKGGFVTAPVVLAARFCGIPAIIHESDLVPGLANRIAMPFAKVICTMFPETAQALANPKAVYTGAIIRKEILSGDRTKAAALCGFREDKPVLLVTGGSSGAVRINDCLREALPQALKTYNIVHLCGKGRLAQINRPGYRQFEYLSEDMPHVLALADVVVSRAGANTIFELLALKKPNVLIPLTKSASRGDQILNARSFAEKGYSRILAEEEMTPESLTGAVTEVYSAREVYLSKMRNSGLADGVAEVCKIIDECASKRI